MNQREKCFLKRILLKKGTIPRICHNAIFNSYNGKSLKTGPKFIANQMALASELNLENCIKI